MREIIEKNNLSALFDAIAISSEIHITKPDPSMFQFVLDRLGAKPEEALLIDDDAQNVTEAKRLGIKGFVFSSHKQLENDLRLIGIAD